ncbi:hypothetical protein CEP51_001749 [Fusarium floridanum]|uniref:Uncharacterized protein n=1 Tax=Fusarium floridanum TaxID=1325733 RepID=A0A428SF55_9HYPO|nr:hypothetical protein CEP51_001749 [Fusarium floridanum]
MAITVWLLVSHDTAIIPGQWSIFVSADKTRPGIIFNNYGAAPGISINPLVTASAITLDVIANPGPDCSKNMRDIAKAIVLPEKPPGTPPSVADSEVWASMFIQGLINQSYLGQFAMEKLRTARQLDLSGPPIDV